ncbi:AAA family ATPase [Halorussus halophilus]|uniref:AAA family ATPase n=1 Tax=Halorussus halophilus TaxID=2650975 RepID=UPI0013015E38|nr:AAA family ATPase [Halorussus halophilus]
MLVVVCGLPGVGKTTVAERIAEETDGRLLRTDVIRKEIISDPEYTDEESQMVYDELFRRGRETVEAGRTAVFDATFQDEAERARARELAAELETGFRLVKVECAEGVVKERIESREDDASDADFEIHELYRETFDAISADHVTVDNSDSPEETERQVEAHF